MIMNTRGLRDTKGQSLPIVILFMGLIIGAAAVTIDYGKVSALRNQAQTATSAAALAAAKALSSDLSNGYNATNGTYTINPQNPTNVADQVYSQNIRSAIANSGLSNPPIVKYFLGGSSTAVATLPSQLVSTNFPIFITVSASGTTPMNFGSALGIPVAKVKPLSTAEVGFQAEVSTSGMVPLGLPAGPIADLPIQNPDGPTGWDSYLTVGSKFFVYGGNQSGNGPAEQPGVTYIQLQNAYGSGLMGWLYSKKYLPSELSIPSLNLQPQTGSCSWAQMLNRSSLPSDSCSFGQYIQPGQIVYFPVVNPNPKANNGQNSTLPVVGVVTAQILTDPSGSGINTGFELKILSQTAVNQTLNYNASSSITNFSYSLVPNNSVPNN
ncbi:hypothetical protein BFX06_06105 [Sulfobacillus thermosulfidooxidans]|nr:hypothetical protein BFX05_03975 [Sulfobacillus thermosulfidooxidans]OLZ13884.1 hypothetical protein BFX06_06105 [Sulfobacillus thermosulfidooxidans]OLZ20502.1 hypothetical protein BFX07_14900 [Sulfobacillus thermosulfidooxidans]